MSDREWILQQVHDALAPLKEKGKDTAYPEWDDALVVTQNQPDDSGDMVERFRRRLEAVHGRMIEGMPALREWLREQGLEKGYIDPELKEQFAGELEGLDLSTEFDRSKIDQYAFGITRATGGIAETGTIILDDRQTTSRLGALAPWVHVAVMTREQLHDDVPSAVAAFDNDPSIVFVTGPSKTADIEGILIKGVHGPGEQLCCLI